jgi:hypothetical protein
MYVAVVPTHVLGKRLSKAEMAGATQFEGHLLVRDWLHGGSGRPVKAAYLENHEGRFPVEVLFPLFSVEVLQITLLGIHLAGYEICSEGGRAVEYRQGWWAKFLSTPPSVVQPTRSY